MAVSAGGATQAEAAVSAAGVHLAALERAFGRIFTVVVSLYVLDFWASSGAFSGQRPGSVAANLLLSLLLIGQAVRTVRRPLSQRDLDWLAVATGALVLVSRIWAVPGSPFLVEAAYLLVNPVVIAWAAVSRRLVVLVPVLLTVLGTGAWHLRGDLQAEVLVTTLGTAALAGFAARLMRRGAQRADVVAEGLSKQMAAQDAALAAEEAERRAANAVHDDVLSVLRAIGTADRLLPWSVLVAKAQQAQLALSQRVVGDGRGVGALGPALRRQVAESAPGLDVRCDLEGDLDVPPRVVEALSAAAGEALRNVAAHAGVDSAQVTACGDGSGVRVIVSDEGAGFDPAGIGPASRGLRHSICGRLHDAGGNAEVISSPGQGTTVALTWSPRPPVDLQALDALDWGRRLGLRPSLVFLAFILPNLLAALALLVLRWQDLRWQIAGVAVFLGLLILALLCARCVGRVRMTGPAAAGLVAANTILAAVGSLAVAPGTTDAYAYWVSGGTTIVIAVVYFLRGPVVGLLALALDLAALAAGLLVTGGSIPRGGWVGVLASPVLAAGLGAAVLAAFRGLSNYTERQLAEYRDRLRQKARAEAVSRVDNAALEGAQRVAGPVLDLVVSGQAPSPALRMTAALANATLRDELLAPGFLTAALAERVRAARTAGARITVDFARQSDAALVQVARELLAAALAGLGASDDVTLQVHPPAEEHPALLIMRVRSARSSQDELRRSAVERGAVVGDLDDHELLVRL